MSDQLFPGWLDNVQRSFKARGVVEPLDDWPNVASAGDLRVAHPIDPDDMDPRMVCVVGVDLEFGVAEVVLVSNEVDFATGADFALGGDRLNLPFDLMVETGNVANLWLIQLGCLVSRVDTALMEIIVAAVRKGPDALPSSSVGLRSLDRDDVRADFQEDERAALERLAADCDAAMKRPQARTRLVLDPVLFSDRQHETEEDRMEKLLRIADEVDRSHGITAPVRAIELHLETVGLRSSCSQGHSYDMFIALTPLYEKILSSAIEEEEGTVELDPERQDVIGQADRELSSMLAHLSKHGCRSVRLLTSHEAWIGEPLGPVAMAKARGFHQMTLQIIRQGLEVSGR